MVNLKVIGLDIEVPAWVILLPSSAILLYIYGCRNHGYYRKQGIGGPRPLPFLGNMLDYANMEEVGRKDIELRKKHGDLVASYMGSRPCLTVYDQEILSQVLVKQFPKFQNRQLFRNGDKILESMLTQLVDDQWKHARSTMSPTFTTGKLRQMADEINRCAKQLREKLTGSEGPFETNKLTGNFTMDVILSTGFGLRADSQSGEDNPFVTHGRKFVDISVRNPLIILGMISPTFGKLIFNLGIQLLDKKATDFFVNIIRQTMESRTKGDRSRADFVQLMCNARAGETNYSKEDEHEVEILKSSGDQVGLTEYEILGNALLFFLAGYDSTSIGLTMLLYNLAQNQDCQNKVHKEIDDILGDQDDVTYDDIMKMPYLDQCMHESLRLFPNALRFSPEGKAQRNPIMWLPFGFGPRNCIGMRLATYVLKLAIVHILRDHRIVTCSKTEDYDKLKWKKGKWLKAENGVWLAAERRK